MDAPSIHHRPIAAYSDRDATHGYPMRPISREDANLLSTARTVMRAAIAVADVGDETVSSEAGRLRETFARVLAGISDPAAAIVRCFDRDADVVEHYLTQRPDMFAQDDALALECIDRLKGATSCFAPRQAPAIARLVRLFLEAMSHASDATRDAMAHPADDMLFGGVEREGMWPVFEAFWRSGLSPISEGDPANGAWDPGIAHLDRTYCRYLNQERANRMFRQALSTLPDASLTMLLQTVSTSWVSLEDPDNPIGLTRLTRECANATSRIAAIIGLESTLRHGGNTRIDDLEFSHLRQDRITAHQRARLSIAVRRHAQSAQKKILQDGAWAFGPGGLSGLTLSAPDAQAQA